MIIDCIKCNKKFEVNSDLIPSEGRTIQCGSCNHVWFFKKNFLNKSKKTKKENPKSRSSLSYNDKIEIDETENIKKDIKDIKVIKKKHELTKYQPKSYFSFSKFLSYILVIIISFIALIIILDTFKSPLYKFFPNLEFLLFNLFETFKDIILFIEDLF